AFRGIDILVNNGGGPPRTSAVDLTDQDVENAVELLLVSAIRLTNLCLPHLRRSGRGRIINITSSSVREPIDNLALSNAVRPGVIGWAKTLAREVGTVGVDLRQSRRVDPPRGDRVDGHAVRADFPGKRLCPADHTGPHGIRESQVVDRLADRARRDVDDPAAPAPAEVWKTEVRQADRRDEEELDGVLDVLVRKVDGRRSRRAPAVVDEDV